MLAHHTLSERSTFVLRMVGGCVASGQGLERYLVKAGRYASPLHHKSVDG